MAEASATKDDRYELFLQRYTECEGRLRAYLWSMLPTWDSVDEVMQNASLVMWRKLDQYDPDTLFVKWATVVCRFEALKYRRTKARDRHVFSDELLEILGSESLLGELHHRGFEIEARHFVPPAGEFEHQATAAACGLKHPQWAAPLRRVPFRGTFDEVHLFRSLLVEDDVVVER